MKICDVCGKKRPRREIKVKDLQWGNKSNISSFELCEKCYQKQFKDLIAAQRNAGPMG